MNQGLNDFVPFHKLPQDFVNSLPPLIPRRRVADLTGGLVHPKTLANLDNLGKGPKERLKLGRCIAYPKRSFVDWLSGRIVVQSESGE